MKKVAVYTGTRNLYSDMVPAAKSLLLHSDVEKIYFLIEDDDFPIELPEEIECINVSDQTYFRPDGANGRTRFTYMAMMRAALSKVFPDLDTILALDCDTIVEHDISDIWDLPIEHKVLAASHETHRLDEYVNIGVTLYNLKLLRESGLVDKVIENLNEIKYPFVEQDCFNKTCRGLLYDMPSEYNATAFTTRTNTPKIIHYAGVKEWGHFPGVNKYRDISFAEIAKLRKKKITAKGGTKYVIHACNDRMWYVNDYLIPSMMEQGISEKQISVWLDKDGVGNLESCMSCFKTMWQYDSGTSGTWHLQDDVIISSDFREKTERHDEGIVCGFSCVEFDGLMTNYVGTVPVENIWFSFPCIRIPDYLAYECAMWFYDWVIPKDLYREIRKEGKHDDMMFKFFVTIIHPEQNTTNLKPNIVEHVDYLIGGSKANKQRKKIRKSFYWTEPELVTKLEARLAERV